MKNSLLITGLMVGVAFSGSAWASACQTCEASYSYFQVKSCECDDAGHVVEMVEGYPHGNEWFMINKTTYDAAGHATSTIQYDSENDYNNNTPMFKSTYTYDTAGNRISSTDYSGAAAIANNTPSSQTRYTYDAYGNRISSTNYSGADNIASDNPTPSSQYHFTYDANGNQTSYIYYKNADDIASNTPWQLNRYTYDENGNQTSWTQYEGADNIASGVPISQYRYTYDENGNRIIETEYYSPERIANNTPTYQRLMTYDENGNRTSGTLLDCFHKTCESIPVPDLSSPIVCAYGYISGCVGDTVQLADGTSAMMQNGQIFNQFSDGSTTLYNADGTIKGYKGKRIYTIEEATKVSGERNTFRIRYK